MDCYLSKGILHSICMIIILCNFYEFTGKVNDDKYYQKENNQKQKNKNKNRAKTTTKNKQKTKQKNKANEKLAGV